MDLGSDSGSPGADRSPRALILVVDDEPDTLATLQIGLSLLGFEVVTAHSAQEALRRVEERVPDVIITDCSMPRVSGLELCRQLRTRERTRRVPILLHTAMDIPNDCPQLYNQTITKPADLDALEHAICAQLSPSCSKGG
jgi:CheY-like chemotaxis protein